MTTVNAELMRAIAYGAAVGDALGVPYEFRPRNSFNCTGMASYGTHGQPAGIWSDDTALLLATTDSIRECGRIDVEDMRHRFEDWYYEGAYAVDGVVFDVGGATARAIEEGRGQAGEWDNGNGSLMRILPLAATDATDDEVRAVSAITHANPISTDACVRLVRFARGLAAGEPVWPELPEGRDDVRSGGYVLDTFDAALWCLKNTDDYRSCVLEAVNLGGDTDTTACVAGGLAAIAYGREAIPSGWVGSLRGEDIIERCTEF